MGDSSGTFAAAVLAIGAGVDYFITEPFFMSVASATSFTGWNPLTVFFYLYAIPYAASVAGVATVIGGLLRR
jgi:hypothetical protein